MKNLDLLAAKAAQEIIKDTAALKADEVDNLITKALGVLQENGVYAGMLFLYSRTSSADKAVAKEAREKLLALTSELGKSPTPNADASKALDFLTDSICDDLDTLLLVKQLWEQTLIYTRYGAKARKDEKEKS